ncbi:glycosyltransferase family 2 protein [Acinetobacter junii]|uniref:Glycosyltransferase family 2 protein n=1 Tax=Acinetobacter junii TaxID=40215 RepID=A0AAX1MH27_ACIJU|nr:glycosyltransferase family 2 protein [Acinetobacter junii]QUY36566.1 glycosyltransferase family 2 protein [Acinetobacter junii]RSE31014.1 glycosyltransferase family 2 protein [Acinetobacter junii]
MFIDVIIPTYQPGTYLIETLQSIQKQKIPFNNFKVTVVLNGCKEPYYSDVKKILSQFSFNYSFIYTEKKGVSNARNLGLESTSSPYILFLDDDDLLSENYLDEMLFSACGEGIVTSNVFGFKESKDVLIDDYLSFKYKFKSKNIIKYRRYLSNSCSKLIPRNVIDVNRFDLKLDKSEDALFMFEISKNIKSITSTSIEVIYYRRLRPNSASRKQVKMTQEILNGFKIMWSFTLVYFKSPLQYNFLLYLTRLLAVIKRLGLTFKSLR